MNARWLIIILFFVTMFSNMNGIALFPFLPTLADQFGTTVSMVGQAITVALVGGAIIGLFAGPLADHYGRRRFVIFGALLMSVSSAGTALSQSFEMLVVVRLIGGLAMGMMAGIGTSIISSTLQGDERRSALAWLVTGAALGAVIAPPFVSTIAELGTWRTGFWVLAAAPFLLILGCLRVVPADQPTFASRFRPIQTITEYSVLLHDRRTLYLLIATVCWSIPWLGGSGYFGSYLIQDHGFSIAGAGYGYMWAAFWFMVGPRVGILLLRHIPLYPLMIASALVLAVTIMTLFWFPYGLPWILVPMALWPMSAGVGMPLINVAISEAARSGQSTAMMGRQFCWVLGGAVGASFGGLMIATGGYALFGIATGMFAIASAGIIYRSTRPETAPAVEAAELSPTSR